MTRKTRMNAVSRALIAVFALGITLITLGSAPLTPSSARTLDQAAPTLPPSWTPAPSLTPIVPPTIQPIVEPDAATPVPGGVPATVTPVAFVKEDLMLTAPLYFLSKRFSDHRYLALSLPGEGDFRKLVKLENEDIVAFDVAKDGKLAYATASGMLYAAGHAKPWKSPAKTDKPQQVTQLMWSPDSSTLVFTLRADEADFLKMTKNPTSGIYQWPETGDPKQIIVDKSAGQGRENYDLLGWSPNSQLLAVSFWQDATKTVEGYGLWTLATRQYAQLYRFDPTDKARYVNAVWMRESKSMLLFYVPSSNSKLGSTIEYFDIAARTRTPLALKPLQENNGAIPKVVSAVRLLPDGRVLVLGAAGRTEPLQMFVGRLGGINLELKTVGLAFRLKWPGFLISPASGFPVYVLDRQFGVMVFNSGFTKAFIPQEMRMGSVNSTDAYGDEFFPAYRIGPATPILPTP